MKPFWMIMSLLTSVLLLNAEGKGSSKAIIYYTPFWFETYEPITPENIREKAKYRFEINGGKEVSALLSLISDGDKNSTFDKKRVRLLVDLEERKRQIMVDANGHVIDGKAERVLKGEKFEQLKNLLSELVKTNGK